MMKEGSLKTPDVYEDIHMPKNSSVGLIIAACAFAVGFGIVWHIWWLAILGFILIPITLIVRSFEEEVEYTIPAHEVAALEKKYL